MKPQGSSSLSRKDVILKHCDAVHELLFAGNFSLLHRVQTGSGPTQPPIRWLSGVLSPGIKRPVLEANHSPLSSVDVKNSWSYNFILPYVFTAWYLGKKRVDFTLLVNLPYLSRILLLLCLDVLFLKFLP
jgi:hypothetical protein